MKDYDWADRLIDSSPKYATGFTQLLGSRPYPMHPSTHNQYSKRLSSIREFQKQSVAIFRSSLGGDLNPAVAHWLLNETPSNLAAQYHRELEDRHYTLPVFFRTDEVVPGRIAEIQCPGSLWGELQLTYDYAAQTHEMKSGPPAIDFGRQLTGLVGETPIVHHMLDNASAPATMRYFIEKTRPLVQYWGIDKGVRPARCNFIRSHSFFGLCADNDFKLRMVRAGKDLAFDLPPYVLFDQKAPLVLPFWTLTRGAFSDAVRSLFVFSTPLLPTGIELPDQSNVSIERFASLSRVKRSYYLKYAGSDVSLNWGSRAIYRLSNMSSESCLALLQKCLEKYEQGHIWIIQKEETLDDNITFMDREGLIHTELRRAKFSAFYGPTDCIGVLAMHRRHNKVHGQLNTVVSFVTPDVTCESETFPCPSLVERNSESDHGSGRGQQRLPGSSDLLPQ